MENELEKRKGHIFRIFFALEIAVETAISSEKFPQTNI